MSDATEPAVATKHVERTEAATHRRRRRSEAREPSLPSGAVRSVVAAAAVLETLAAAEAPMRLTEIARALGAAKARIHRHLTTLRHLGLVEQERSSECYRLGRKLLHLGQAAAEQFDLRRLAEPYMARLRDLSHQTVVLSVPAQGEAMVSAVMESSNLVTISVRRGAHLPAHASAQGRIILAFAPPEAQRRALSRKLAALTPRTITAPAALRQRLAAIREELYELAPGETLLGITTLAAPLLDREEMLVGTIAIVGTDQYIPAPVDARQLGLVRACAAAISARLGSTAYQRLALPLLAEFALP
ncbi:MAG TPA: IclR family transcriptional regulator [Stellaceae bacterium]|nr:IclR family transcriptional regulator [Stellaceae bacterium]